MYHNQVEPEMDLTVLENEVKNFKFYCFYSYSKHFYSFSLVEGEGPNNIGCFKEANY